MGTCKCCGQVIIDTVSDEEATANCQCIEAENLRKLRQAVSEAKEIVAELFGEGCTKRGLVALHSDIIEALYSLVELIGEGAVTAVKVDLPGICSIKMKKSGNFIKVERSEGRKYQGVAGEQ